MVDRLSYRYPTSSSLALDQVSFTVETGEVVGIIGRNQSGKSTLCQALVGLVPHFYKGAYGGRVLIGDKEVKQHSIAEMARQVGMVFQNPTTQLSGAKATVFEEIGFGLENAGISREEMHQRIESTMSQLGIEPLRDRNPFALSGGQMQRVAIASMLVMQPEVIVFDEPTSQLDPQGTEEVFQTIQQLSRQGVTIILVEHKMEKMAQFCDRLLLLDQGRFIAFGSPSTIFSQSYDASLPITLPIYTQVAKASNQAKSDSTYPVTLEEAYELFRNNR